MDDQVIMNVVVDKQTPAGVAWVAAMGGQEKWYPTPYIDLSNGMSERAGVKYASVSTFGRSEDYKTFVGVSNREVTLSLYYVAGETGSVINSTDMARVIKNSVVFPALWFENLKYPTVADASGGTSQPPPPVFLVIGNLIAMRAIVTDCHIDWQGPYHNTTQAGGSGFASTNMSGGDFLPHAARVTLTFTSVSKSPGGAFKSDNMDYQSSAVPRPAAGDIKSWG